MHSNSNPRSALLSGLRTGGVRTASQPSIVPHTAAIGASFNMQRHPSYTQQHSHFPEEEELADMLNYGMQLNGGTHNGNHRIPASAGPLDGSNRFQQQQQAAFLQQMAAQRQLNGVNGMGVPGLGAVDHMQMQLMQLELMKLQALQQAQQQYQVELELLAQSQRQQQLQQQQQQQQQRGPSRRPSTLAFGGEPPATAGPGQTSFETRGTHQFIRNQSESPNDQDVPKTAALSGKFGGRPVLSGLNPNATVFTMSSAEEPSTPKTATPGIGRTTVISGGTSLGGVSTPVLTNAPATPSKSDSASSWRRPNAVANGSGSTTPTRSVGVPTSTSSPTIRLAPGGEVDTAPSPLRSRPSPLRFGDRSVSVDVETGSESELDYYTANFAQLATSASSSSDNEKDSSPSTPPSAGSSNPITREEASKRLYEGLGIGRPIQLHVPPVHVPKQPANTVLRQPRGPPAAVDELGPRNFASRMQKKLVMAA